MKKSYNISDGIMTVDKDVLDSMEYNGTYLPNVEHVTFNLRTEEKVAVKDENGEPKRIPAKNRDGSEIKGKKGNVVTKVQYETRKLDNPVLVTRVTFEGGTSVTVRNSEHDPVETEQVEVEKGSGVKATVASRCSKERGIAYAILKRACGIVGDKGEVGGNGLGRILNEIVDEGYDQQFEEAKSRLLRSKKKAAFEELKKQPKKAKQKRYSYNELVQLAGPILESLAKKAQTDPGFVQKLLGA